MIGLLEAERSPYYTYVNCLHMSICVVLSPDGVTIDRIWISNRTYYTLIQLVTTFHTRSSKSVTVFTSRCLVAASNSGFPNCPHSSATSFSQQQLTKLNRSSPLTNWLRVRVRVTLRLSVYRQSVRLGANHFEDHNQRFICLQLNHFGRCPLLRNGCCIRVVAYFAVVA
jgi:hypothetical protein